MRTRVTLSNDSYLSYQYDGLNRLIDETKRYPDDSLDYFNRFTFDPVGNRTRLHRSRVKTEEDDFNRAQIGEDWQEVAGWWLIEEGRVKVHDARADAQLVYQKPVSGDYTVEATVHVTNTGTKKVSGLIVSYLSNNDFYYAGMKIHDGNNKGKGESPNESAWTLGRCTNSRWIEITSSVDEIKKNQDYNLKVVVTQEHVLLYVDGILKLEADISGLAGGKVGLCCEKNLVEFDDFKVKIRTEEYIDYLYNGDNQLLNETITPKGGTISLRTYAYTYDNNGNLIQKDDSEEGITTYKYDYENRLAKIGYDDGTASEYSYDGAGRRIEKNVNGVITRYIYDNEDILQELNSQNSILATYTHGPGIDEPISMERDGQTYWYHADGLGSLRQLTDLTGAEVQSYIYDSFGNIVDRKGSIANPYTYTGREYDPESSLYYYRARYYNPKIGRFLQEDPMLNPARSELFKFGKVRNSYIPSFESLLENSQTLNPYVYAQNNPVRYIDPYGLYLIPPPSPLCVSKVLSAIRNTSGKNDKYRHCIVGCNISRYCNPIYCVGAAFLKEIFDAVGLGTPDVDDIKATLDGCLCVFSFKSSQKYCKCKGYSP